MANEAPVPLYMAFMDYKKAFDTVKHNKLWTVLKGMCLNGSTVDTLWSLYEGQQAAVRVQSEITDWFAIGKGVRQGCVISPLSFNCYSENVMMESVYEFTSVPGLVSQ